MPAAPPVMPPVTDGADQEYVVPVGTIPFVPLTGVAVKATPLQVIAVIGLMVAAGFTVTGTVIAGTGFTVTVTVKCAPWQLPEVGVTVYMAV